ncbi:MAG: hypothetical protein ABI785_08585 [Gemmatimonadales bacterium]
MPTGSGRGSARATLNIASWLGNYELDAIVEDEGFARIMAQQYADDLTNATEVLLGAAKPDRSSRAWVRSRGGGSAGRAVAGAIRLGNTVTAAMTDHRVLEPADTRIVGAAGAGLIAAAVVAVFWPGLAAIPFAVLTAWVGGALLVRAYRLYRPRRQGGAALGADAPTPVRHRADILQ